MEAGTYIFCCYAMPWTARALGVIEVELEVPVELTKEEIQRLVEMRHWAWDNKWFENSHSETVFSELFKKHMPDLFERVHQAAHIQFCEKYPNRQDINGWGVYEIFDPDEIDDLARETYVEKGDD